MKLACVLITHLRAKAEMQRRPHLKDQPVLIVDRGKPGAVVVDHFPAAASVSAGMPLEQALSRQAGTVALDADEAHYRRVFRQVLSALQGISDRVEDAGLGVAYVALDGLETLYGGVDGLRFGHLLTVQRICHPHEGCKLESVGTGTDPSAQQRSGIPPPRRPGCRDHGSQRTPHQAPPGCLSQARCRGTGPRQPGTASSQRHPRGCGICRGEAGQQRLRRCQSQPPHRATAGTGGHRPEPPHSASHPGQGRHRQSPQPPLPATPFPSSANAPGGHAVTDRRQSAPLAGGPGGPS